MSTKLPLASVLYEIHISNGFVGITLPTNLNKEDTEEVLRSAFEDIVQFLGSGACTTTKFLELG